MPLSLRTVETRRMPPGQVVGLLRRHRRLDRLITDWETTPGKLRVTRIVLVVGILLVGGVGVSAANARVDTTRDIAEHLEPLNAAVTSLYRSLADADATVAVGFLSGGVEPNEVRARYDRDVVDATASLAQAGSQAGAELVTAKRIADITAQLPVYTGLVERARANNRQGLAVGVAYLRRASELMQSSILPEAAELQRRQATRLRDAYLLAGQVLVVALLAGGASLAGLIWAQVFLFRRTHRIFNIGLVAASAAVLVGLVWWAVAGVASSGLLTSSLGHSRSVSDALGPAQIAALQARAVESLRLVTRAGDATEPDFDARMQRLARHNGAGGALGAAKQFITDDKGHTLVQEAVDDARGYVAAHQEVLRLDDAGDYTAAVNAVRTEQGSAAVAFNRLNSALDKAVTQEREVFRSDISRAQGWLHGLPLGTGGLALVAAAGVALGVRRRLEEYR